MSTDLLQELLHQAADGAYIVDDDQRIAAWNEAAEKILGFTAKEVIGRQCYQVIGGRTDGGCLACRRDCVPFVAGGRGERVPSFDVLARTKDGQTRWLNITIIAVNTSEDDEQQLALIHLFRDIQAKKQAETFANEVVARARQFQLPATSLPETAESTPPQSALTLREYQVLHLLAQGNDTAAIAAELVVSQTTVRNHVQHILHKLGVHSRLEAVAYARAHNLLD
ncbi:MAG: PAS domain-containing protein [Caldilineaceae bacterium]|nr:PAS domain-containing protein [Caldilineaceae bacterium]